MIYNATLLQLIPPEPGAPGPDIEVRCAMTPLTQQQVQISIDAGWDAVWVVYIPMRKVPNPRPVQEGQAIMRADGETEGTSFRIAQIFQRHSQVLGHIQMYLSPAE
jgi:hypothetical protein